jgi:hypothetical protein
MRLDSRRVVNGLTERSEQYTPTVVCPSLSEDLHCRRCSAEAAWGFVGMSVQRFTAPDAL